VATPGLIGSLSDTDGALLVGARISTLAAFVFIDVEYCDDELPLLLLLLLLLLQRVVLLGKLTPATVVL
jgi:hypothetical protein